MDALLLDCGSVEAEAAVVAAAPCSILLCFLFFDFFFGASPLKTSAPRPMVVVNYCTESMMMMLMLSTKAIDDGWENVVSLVALGCSLASVVSSSVEGTNCECVRLDGAAVAASLSKHNPQKNCGQQRFVSPLFSVSPPSDVA